MDYAMTPPIEESALHAPGIVYAGLSKRLLAFFIDMCVIQGLSLVCSIPLWILIGDNPPKTSVPEWIWGVVAIAFSIVFYGLYFSVQESSAKQATLGKKALGLYVADLNGQRITFRRAIIRFFAMILSVVTLSIGFFIAGFTSKKQSLHDMIAGTLVLSR